MWPLCKTLSLVPRSNQGPFGSHDVVDTSTRFRLSDKLCGRLPNAFKIEDFPPELGPKIRFNFPNGNSVESDGNPLKFFN